MKRFGLGPSLPGTAIVGRDGKIVSSKPTVITRAELKKLIDVLLASDLKAKKSELAMVQPDVDFSPFPVDRFDPARAAP